MIHDQDQHQDNYYDNVEDFDGGNYEDFGSDPVATDDEDDIEEEFEANSVCKVFNYSLNLFGTRVNIWILFLVISVIVGALFYYQNKRLPSMSDFSFSLSNKKGGFSSTSSMNTVYNQMGGFDSPQSLSSTPNFIRNLKY